MSLLSVGHGIMMAHAYNLYSALDTCDTFDSFFEQDGCWQGVFMENVNAGQERFAREGIFSDTDPLNPCNVVDEKYRHECYINHSGWLMVFFNNDVKGATSACLKASSESLINSCLQSIGLMVTNPGWQNELLQEIPDDQSFIEIAWSLCESFPAHRKDQCVIGAVDNIFNFNDLDSTEAERFCDLIDDTYTQVCFRTIGINFKRQINDPKLIIKKCGLYMGESKQACIDGAEELK